MSGASALGHGLYACEVCHLLNHKDRDESRCARCGFEVRARKPYPYQRAWAFLIAAAVLYIPANLQPVLHTSAVYGHRSDTILSGVIHLWVTGSPELAIIVFIASIVVPAAKLFSLAFLLIAAKRQSLWRPEQRAKLYRATHHIGRWSMVDIYVGATLVALVHLGPFANIEPGVGAIPFGAVVILTMLASMSFDPRLTWDPLDRRRD